MLDTPTEVLKTALAIAIPLGIAALTTWINITIRFAPDAAHAIQEAKKIFLKVAGWTANGVLVGGIIWQIVWPDHNARASILIILMYSFSLFNSYVIWLHRFTLNLISQQSNSMLTLAQTVRELVELATATTDTTP
jgi:hypothetical protein